MQKNKWFNKKRTAGVLAVVLIAAIALSGTFAYMQNGPHRSSYLSASSKGIFQLNMSNNFNDYKKDSWDENESIDAPFFVNSLTYMPEFTEDAYVAVNVMEYIKVKTPSDWIYVQDVDSASSLTDKALFAIDNNGAYMTYAATVAKLGAANVTKYEPTPGTDFGMINASQTAAQENAFNGIHGTPMRKPGRDFTYGDVTAMDYVKAHGAENPTTHECSATCIEGWSAVDAGVTTTEEARDYVSFNQTAANIMTLADWQSKFTADVNDPDLHGDFWILGDNGWAYYAKPLSVGQKTANLIEGLKLNETVDEIDFYMHYDMVAASIDDIDRLGETTEAGLGTFSVFPAPTGIKMPGMPTQLISSFKKQALIENLENALGDLIADPSSPVEPGAKIEDVNGHPVIVSEDGDVYLIPENIPDSVLLEKIADLLGKSDGDTVTLSELEGITRLEITYDSDLSDLSGIAVLTKLNWIDVTGSENITAIDLTLFPELDRINIAFTKISQLDTSKNPKLRRVSAASSMISSLDLSNNPMVNYLDIRETNISAVNVTGLPLTSLLYDSVTTVTGVLTSSLSLVIIDPVRDGLLTHTAVSTLADATQIALNADGAWQISTSGQYRIYSASASNASSLNATRYQSFSGTSFMSKNGILAIGGTKSGSSILVPANGEVITATGIYVLENGGRLTTAGVLTANAGNVTWTPVVAVGIDTQTVAEVSGTAVNITASANQVLTNHN